jgi:uncharacterized membrane protein YhaH (DUF805 family)
VVSLLFGFNGRINRAQYWLGVCIGSFGGMMLFFLLGLMTAPAGNFAKETMDPIAAMQLVSSMGVSFGLPLVVMGWIGSALQVKRFHDRGRSGLWILAPMVPAFMIVSSIVGGLMTGSHPEQVLSSVIMWFVLLQVVHLVMFVDLGCMPSKPGPNKYGNPPNGGLHRRRRAHQRHANPRRAIARGHACAGYGLYAHERGKRDRARHR